MRVHPAPNPTSASNPYLVTSSTNNASKNPAASSSGVTVIHVKPVQAPFQAIQVVTPTPSDHAVQAVAQREIGVRIPLECRYFGTMCLINAVLITVAGLTAAYGIKSDDNSSDARKERAGFGIGAAVVFDVVIDIAFCIWARWL